MGKYITFFPQEHKKVSLNRDWLNSSNWSLIFLLGGASQHLFCGCSALSLWVTIVFLLDQISHREYEDEEGHLRGAVKLSEDDDDTDYDNDEDSDDSPPPPLPPRLHRKPLPSNHIDDAEKTHNHNGLTAGLGNGSATTSCLDSYNTAVDDTQYSEGSVSSVVVVVVCTPIGCYCSFFSSWPCMPRNALVHVSSGILFFVVRRRSYV